MKHARESYSQIQDPSGKIPDDEPVFLLRAQDPVAADLVRQWANETEDIGGADLIVALARGQAELMEAWPIKKAVADLSKSDQLSFQFRNMDAGEEIRKVEADQEASDADQTFADALRQND